MIVEGLDITNGVIKHKGVAVGRCVQDFKHGYHPAIFVQVGKEGVWFEQDEKNLIEKIVVWVKKTLNI